MALSKTVKGTDVVFSGNDNSSWKYVIDTNKKESAVRFNTNKKYSHKDIKFESAMPGVVLANGDGEFYITAADTHFIWGDDGVLYGKHVYYPTLEVSGYRLLPDGGYYAEDGYIISVPIQLSDEEKTGSWTIRLENLGATTGYYGCAAYNASNTSLGRIIMSSQAIDKRYSYTAQIPAGTSYIRISCKSADIDKIIAKLYNNNDLNRFLKDETFDNNWYVAADDMFLTSNKTESNIIKLGTKDKIIKNNIGLTMKHSGIVMNDSIDSFYITTPTDTWNFSIDSNNNLTIINERDL